MSDVPPYLITVTNQLRRPVYRIAYLDLVTDRLRSNINIKGIYVSYYSRHTLQLGVIPSSIMSTLSATFILFQLPSNTWPLTKPNDEQVYL